jgi:hypothetical protein
MSKINTNSRLIVTIVVLLILPILVYLVIPIFPTFEYLDPSLEMELVPLSEYNKIADNSANFIWSYRVLDLTGQAFVIVTAVVCCLALLKSTEDDI